MIGKFFTLGALGLLGALATAAPSSALTLSEGQPITFNGANPPVGTGSVTFNQFNPSLGTLNGVTLKLLGSGGGTATFLTACLFGSPTCSGSASFGSPFLKLAGSWSA